MIVRAWNERCPRSPRSGRTVRIAWRPSRLGPRCASSAHATSGRAQRLRARRTGALSWLKGDGAVDSGPTWTSWFLAWPALAIWELFVALVRAACHLDDSGAEADPCATPGGGVWHFVPFAALALGGVVAR